MNLKKLVLCFLTVLCVVAFAQDARLRNGNILSCETYTFRSLIIPGKLDVIQVPEFYKELGIKGISYNARYYKSSDDSYLDKVKAAVKKADRIVVCYVLDGDLAVPDEAQRKRQIEDDKRGLMVAHKLGAPLVRINLGGYQAKDDPDGAGLERVIAAFKELLPLARKLNVRMAIENHGGVSRNAANIIRIIQATDPKWVGALVDFGNFPPEKRYEEIARLAPYAFGTHVKVNRFDEHGEAAEYDFPRVLGLLKGVHYKGPHSIEYEGEGDPMEGARQTKALLVKYW
jgi:sugar phosphate isomerase/epimerase